jgi:hypothetical protein
MTDIVKPFKVTRTTTEPDGNTGVWFWAQKTTYGEWTKGDTTNVAKIATYISVEPEADIDAAVYAFLQTGDWV